MPVVPRIHKDHLEFILDGDFTSDEVRRKGEEALESPELSRPVRVLLDYSGAAGLQKKKSEDLRETAAFFARWAGRVQRVAILAPGDLAFGLMRMAAAYASEEGMKVSVFRSRAEARSWLGVGEDG